VVGGEGWAAAHAWPVGRVWFRPNGGCSVLLERPGGGRLAVGRPGPAVWAGPDRGVFFSTPEAERSPGSRSVVW